MEARNVEIARFAKRAAEYKRALALAPDARGTEVAAVVGIVVGICKQRGLPLEQAQIVDLMAGSGTLTRALKTAGFGRVTPLEACQEMHPADADDLGYRGAAAFRDLAATLSSIRPDVIVCLAGFHHLLVYAGGTVDTAASLAAQVETIRESVQSLEDGGAFVLVDICECPTLADLKIDAVNVWSTTALALPASLTDEEKQRLRASRTLSDYSEELERILGRVEKNCPTEWFRQVVDRQTSLGHKDAAVSPSLLRVLNCMYEGRWRASLFACHWLFESAERAKDFVLHKFGFLVGGAEVPNDGELAAAMERYLGFRVGDGRASLAWGLVACVITPEPRVKEFDGVLVMNVLLVFALLLLGVRIIGRLMYSSDVFDETLGNGFWLTLGACAAVLVDLLKRRYLRATRGSPLDRLTTRY